MADMRDVDMSDAGELSEGRKAIPPGDYQVYMEESERKTTSKGDGEMLACTFVVMGGEYEGAKIFHNFNFWNQNKQAVDISKASWRALCEATLGQPNALNNDSTSLHNKPFWAKIDNVAGRSKNAEGVYVEDPNKRVNELVFRKGTIRMIGAQAPAAQAAPQAAAAPAAAAPAASKPVTPGVGKAPWKK